MVEIPDVRRRDGVKTKRSREVQDGGSAQIANRASADAIRGNSRRLRIERGQGESGASANEKKKGGASGSKGLPSLAALRPTFGTISRISGSPSRDYVEGVPQGEGTFLNTREFRYATFFYRVRDSVASRWEGPVQQEYRRRDPTGNIYGVRDRATMLSVELTDDGRLFDVRVARSSGLDFLDRIAVDAFRQAEPFPNPPAGIVDNGAIRFNFQFVLTMGSSGLRLFR